MTAEYEWGIIVLKANVTILLLKEKWVEGHATQREGKSSGTENDQSWVLTEPYLKPMLPLESPCKPVTFLLKKCYPLSFCYPQPLWQSFTLLGPHFTHLLNMCFNQTNSKLIFSQYSPTTTCIKITWGTFEKYKFIKPTSELLNQICQRWVRTSILK